MDELKYAVICVDDDPIILQLIDFQMKKLVNESTTIVETAVDPRGVIEKLAEIKSYGLRLLFMVTDYQMPGKNGAELIRNVKSEIPDLPCILLSGQANEVAVDELQRDGLLYAFIGKPWKEEEMRVTIAPLIENT